MRLLSSCLACLSLLVVPAFGQDSCSVDSNSFGDDVSLFLRLAGHTYSSPARWDGGDWLTAGGVVAATAGAGLLDNEAFDMMARNQVRVASELSRITVRYGSGITGLVVTGGFYGAGLAFENAWLRETGILLASALAVSVPIEFAMKFAIGRARPYTGLGRNTFKPFNGSSDFLSFPSGHTVVAFTLSSVLSERIGNTWASIGLYSLATMVAASRMYTRSHWFSDVVFGGTLATFVGRSVVKRYERGMTEDDDATGFRIVPHTNGVMVVWRF